MLESLAGCRRKFSLKFRNYRSQMFFKKCSLKDSANFIGKHLCWSLYKVAKHRCFRVNFGKFLRTFFYRPLLVAASKNLRNVFVQQFFSLQLNLCLHQIYFHSYSFATSMARMSSNIFSYRKKCIMRKLS